VGRWSPEAGCGIAGLEGRRWSGRGRRREGGGGAPKHRWIGGCISVSVSQRGVFVGCESQWLYGWWDACCWKLAEGELTLWTPITPLLAWAALAAATDDMTMS
jgi:hypothetical protein